jgi:hypothetical protein
VSAAKSAPVAESAGVGIATGFGSGMRREQVRQMSDRPAQCES